MKAFWDEVFEKENSNVNKNPDNHDYIDYKGIDIVRRDRCGLVRNTMDKSMIEIMINKNVNRAVKIIHVALSNLTAQVRIGAASIYKNVAKGCLCHDTTPCQGSKTYDDSEP